MILNLKKEVKTMFTKKEEILEQSIQAYACACSCTCACGQYVSQSSANKGPTAGERHDDYAMFE